MRIETVDNASRRNLINELFSAEAQQLVEQRHRGGSSGKKGSRYEDLYAIFQVVRLAKLYIEQNQESGIAEQTFAFVDDLEIVEFDATITSFQLKNVKQLSWNTEPRSIVKDFFDQNKLNLEQGFSSKVVLVVSCPVLADKLQRNIPQEISSFSRVELFENPSRCGKLEFWPKGFRENLKAVCSNENEQDKLEALLVGVLGAWSAIPSSNGSYVMISDILNRLKQLYPPYVRVVGDVNKLRNNVKEILEAIPDFSFSIHRGFFSWEYDVTDNGTLPYDCNHKNFDKFQELIVKNNPRSFDEIEGLLL